MTAVKRLTVLLANAGVLIGCSSAMPAFADEKPGTGVAVVELFTSEGCSSCPPADAAVGDLIRAHKGGPVYALAFHVDYWNDLGWADPFSQKAFTDRQNEYRRLLGLDNIYTPQAVVNGRVEFVGSNRAQLQQAVEVALATPAMGTVSATATRNAAAMKVAVATSKLPPETVIRIAVVQTAASTDVPRGENGGRTLKHENVVRAFASVRLDDTGKTTAKLAAPAGGWPKDGAIIVYAQRPTDGQVLAATDAKLSD